MAQRFSEVRQLAELRLSRLAPTIRRVSELSETRVRQARLWLCLLAGLVEYYLPSARSNRVRRVIVGRGPNARALYLRANGTDVYTFYAIFIRGIYDAVLPLAPGGVILDLGANIGLTAAYFAMECEDARIVAVEPEASNVGLLYMNLRGFHASIHHAAVSERSGKSFLELRGPTAHTLAYSGAGSQGELQEIQTLTLDDLEALERLDCVAVIKADIEGAETPIFTRAWPLLERCDAITMEIHVVDERHDIVSSLGGQGFSHELGARTDLPDVFRR